MALMHAEKPRFCLLDAIMRNVAASRGSHLRTLILIHLIQLRSPRRCRLSPSPSSRFENCCLIDAIRSLGVKVPYTGPGPYFALADGNRLLAPWRPAAANAHPFGAVLKVKPSFCK